MTNGEKLAEAHRLACAAVGRIGYMLIKQKITRAESLWAAETLQRAAELLKEIGDKRV